MQQGYEFTMDDGTTYTVDSDGRDIRAWESRYEQSFLRTPLSFTVIAQMAYLAAVRTGVLNGRYPDYETFDAHCVAASGKRGETIGNPTLPARTAGSSAESPSRVGRSRPPSKRKDRT